MTKTSNGDGDDKRANGLRLHSLPPDSTELRAAEAIPQEEIDEAIERARRALEELQRAPRQSVTIDSNLRFR